MQTSLSFLSVGCVLFELSGTVLESEEQEKYSEDHNVKDVTFLLLVATIATFQDLLFTEPSCEQKCIPNLLSN